MYKKSIVTTDYSDYSLCIAPIEAQICPFMAKTDFKLGMDPVAKFWGCAGKP